LKGLLERRLDAFVKRLGFGNSIYKARQLVTHGFFKVNDKPTSSPTFIVQVGDCISVADHVWERVFDGLSQKFIKHNKTLFMKISKSLITKPQNFKKTKQRFHKNSNKQKVILLKKKSI
jgi:ribosomal protein S4